MKRIAIVFFALIIVLVVAHADTQAQQGSGVYYRTGAFPRDIAFDGELVWVANWYDNSITRLWAVDGEVFDTLEHDPNNPSSPVGQGPVALAWDGEYMWLANDTDNTVYRLNQEGQLVTPFDATDGVQYPVDMFYDNVNIWVVNQGNNTVMKINAELATVQGTFQVGEFPTAMTWDGEHVWVTNGRDNSVSVLNTVTGDEVAEIQVNLMPMSIVFDGIHVWIAHYDGSILIIRSSSFEIVGSIDDHPGSPQRPIQLLYAFEHVWVTNVHDASFTIISALNLTTIRTINWTTEGEFPGTLGYTDHEVWSVDWLTQSIKVYDPELIWTQTAANEVSVITMTPGIWLPSPIPSPTPTIQPTPTLCFAFLPPRLQNYEEGYITNNYGNDRWRLRDAPGSTLTQQIGLFPPFTTFKVLSGPVCIDGVAWFEVEIEGQTGWMSETFNEVEPPVYALEGTEE